MGNERKYDLEERLIEFACLILDVEEKLPHTRAGNHLGDQLMRSGTSPSLNYGEVQAAESRKDFIHKMALCLKELRETKNCLRIINRRKMLKEIELSEKALKECIELVSIFAKSIDTTKKNLNK